MVCGLEVVLLPGLIHALCVGFGIGFGVVWLYLVVLGCVYLLRVILVFCGRFCFGLL